MYCISLSSLSKQFDLLNELLIFSNESILDCVKLNNKKGWEQDKLLRIVRPVPPRKKAQVVLTNDAYPVELLSCEMLIDY